MEITRLFDILERDLKEFPKEDALCGKENGIWIKHSTKDYVNKVNYISYGLMQLGIKRGDCIATITPNRPEWNFLDMAIMQIGAIHVAIYPTISEADYRYILNHADVKLIFVSGWELLRKINNIIEGIPSLTDKVYTFRNLRGYRHLSELIELGKANPSPEYLQKIKDSITPDDVISIVYTSGTTGNPKGVLHEYGNVDRAAETDLTMTGCALISPLNVVAAIIIGTSVLHDGGTLFVIPYSVVKDPSAVRECFVRYGITQTLCAPSVFHLFRDIPSLELIIVASEPAYGIRSDDPKLQVYNFYGMSESAFVIAYKKLDEPNEISPIGRACPGVVMTLRDEEGKENCASGTPMCADISVCRSRPRGRLQTGKPAPGISRNDWKTATMWCWAALTI